MSSPDAQTTFRAAIIDALTEEMERDPTVILLGEDIGKAGGVFKQTAGLFDRFGAGRVIDTPISEQGAFGMAVGAAMAGVRPVFEVMFGDFMTLIMDSLVNQAAKVSYMSAGQFSVPMVVRTTMGTGANLGPQHSQALYAWACHVPGLKVVIPSDPCDAKALYKAAIRDPNPVLVFEDRMLYGLKGFVGGADELARIGQAVVKREGCAVTVVAIGRMVRHALAAAAALASEGIDIEVVDPRSLVPLDVDTLVESVRKTHRAIVIDGGVRAYGAGAEIAATLSDVAFDWLDAPVRRLCAATTPIPFSRSLEPLLQPNERTVADAVRSLLAT